MAPWKEKGGCSNPRCDGLDVGDNRPEDCAAVLVVVVWSFGTISILSNVVESPCTEETIITFQCSFVLVYLFVCFLMSFFGCGSSQADPRRLSGRQNARTSFFVCLLLCLLVCLCVSFLLPLICFWYVSLFLCSFLC